MQILAIVRRLTERFTQTQFDALLDDEAEGVRRLYADGIVRSAWSRSDLLGACLLLECESLEAAQAALDTLPLFARRMVESQLIPIKPYRGFGPRN